MSIATKLRARLAAIAGVTDLVGSAPARIYPVKAPQSAALPYVVYEITSVPINHSVGATTDDETSLTVYCYAATYDGAVALALAVKGDESSSPAGLSGWIDADTAVWHLQNEQDDLLGLMGGQDQPEAYVVIQDYFI